MATHGIKKALKPFIPKFYFTAREWLRFFRMQRNYGFKVSERPYFDEDSLVFFKKELERCDFYLEYGCGGSTILAAKLGKEFVSADTDKYFMGSVMKKLGPAVPKNSFVHGDIGLSGPWGFPLFKRPTQKRVNQWKNYPEAPWREIEKRHKTPDLVLIDGRFRVACALTCIKHLAGSPGARILVDDYLDRPYYKEIERFAEFEPTHSRMGLFHPIPCDEQELDAAIMCFEPDWR